MTKQSPKKEKRIREQQAWSADKQQPLVDVMHADAVRARRQKPWTFIFEFFFSYRTQGSIKSRWSKIIEPLVERREYKPQQQPPPPEIKTFLQEMKQKGKRHGISWTKEEDRLLVEGVNKYGRKWSKIAATCFEGMKKKEDNV